MNSPLNETKETFNEILVLLSVYMLMCFSRWIEDPEFRFQLGYGYIGLVALYGLVHLVILIHDTVS